jgi:hypothetical protein
MKWAASCALALAVIADAAAQSSSVDLEFFEKKVRPVLFERCYSCHSTQAKKLRGGLLLDSRAALLKGGDTGPAVVAADPEMSLLIKAIRYTDATLHMPPSGKLPESEMLILTEWVRRGSPFPDSKSEARTRRSIDLEAGRKFWSFQPVRQMALPQVRHKAWPKQRIDHFILAEQEKRGLTSARPAARTTLIRRAALDLVGLPPTPEEVAAFERDASPDAYPRLIERLLASPHYGERWGRYWLDVARYCDIGEPWS